MSELKIVAVRVGEAPIEDTIKNDADAIEAFIGGYRELVPVGQNAYIVCDEDGRLKDKPVNCDLGLYPIVGDFFVVAMDESGFIDLTSDQVTFLIDKLTEFQIKP